MKPPTSSLLSMNGPSETPADVTTLPVGASFPPRSTRFASNVSRQALKAAHISCISAGDGGDAAAGALRWIHRYFFGIGSPLPHDARGGAVLDTRSSRRARVVHANDTRRERGRILQLPLAAR